MGVKFDLLRDTGVAGGDAAAPVVVVPPPPGSGGAEVLVGDDVLQLDDLDLRLASAQGGHPRRREQIGAGALLERPDDHPELRIGQNAGNRRHGGNLLPAALSCSCEAGRQLLVGGLTVE